MRNYISRVEAEELCNGLIKQYAGENSSIPSSVDIDDFVKNFLKCTVVYENIAEENLDRIGFTSDGKRPLHIFINGSVKKVIYPKNTIVLDKYLLNKAENNHRRFVLGHEAGHILLNKMYPDSSAGFHHFASRDYENYSIDDMRERYSIVEWQANMLSAALLMPSFVMIHALKKFNGGRRLPVYGNNIFNIREKTILNKMSKSLKVSYTALVIRLKDLGMLKHHDVSEYIQMELGLGGDT